MCLRVDKVQHPNNLPIILDRDLYVTKYLEHVYTKNPPFKSKWMTPFQRKHIRFIFGKAVLKAKIKEGNIRDNIHCLKIYKGIHSMIDAWGYNLHGIPFIAKIPKGTKVYYGTDDDIVSEKLIIYK